MSSANSGPFGDAPDLVHVGVQRGHPFQGGPGDAVPNPEVRQLGDLVDKDVGVLDASLPHPFSIGSRRCTPRD